MKKFTIFILLTLFLQLITFSQSNFDECTIGVAHGSTTQDGRPLIWKTRDYNSYNMRLKYDTYCSYKFIYICPSTNPLYSTSGLNEHGLAIFKSNSDDLSPAPTGPNDSDLQRHALGYCKTIDEFQAYLDSTNITGRQATGNFAMLDSTGAAVIFEVGGYEYWRFDAQNAPDGYIIRTNFSINGGGSSGIQRYNRSSTLVEAFHLGDSLNHKSLIRYQMRDFSDGSSQPYPIPYLNQVSPSIPYGYFYTLYSICNSNSTSTAVIQGILLDEKPELSTMWAMLGHPAASITSPFWPVGPAPPITQGDLCDIALMIKDILFDFTASTWINSHLLRDTIAGGLWTCTFPTEDYILDTAELFLNNWRGLDSIPVVEMLDVENELAEMAYNSLVSCYENLTVGVEVLVINNEFSIYPNPTSNNVSLVLPPGMVGILIQIINIQGKVVRQHEVSSNNFSFNVSSFPKGLYFIRIHTSKGIEVKKLIIQ